MQKYAFLLCLALGLAGCAATPVPATHGSFIQAPMAGDNEAMVNDVVKKLTALYPPAKTRFNLQHATPDTFGMHLVTALRGKGYAVAEVKPGVEASPVPAGEQSLAYIVDQPLAAGLYRVTLLIKSQTLSRVYQSANGTLAPAGAWVRKE